MAESDSIIFPMQVVNEDFIQTEHPPLNIGAIEASLSSNIDPFDYQVLSFEEIPWEQESESYKVLRYCIRVLPLSFATGSMLAGGLLVRAILGISPGLDVDIFCYTNKHAEYIKEKFNIKNPDQIRQSRYFKAETIAFSDTLQLQICLVHSFPALTLSLFPSFHAMIATDGKEVLVHKEALDCILNKVIKKNPHAQNPVNNWYEKYEKLGFMEAPNA